MIFSSRLGMSLRPDFIAAVRRFPVPVIAALVGCTSQLLSIERVIPPGSDLDERLLLGAAAAFGLGVAGTIALESRGRLSELVLVQVLALALGMTVGVALKSLWLTPVLLLASLTLMTVAAPGLAVGGTPVRAWVFNAASCIGFLTGFVGAGCLTLGTFLITFTLKTLFGFSFPFPTERYVSTVSFLLILPLYWLALQPKLLQLPDEEPQPDLVTRALGALTDFILLPLLLLYGVILHAYAVKIAIAASLPRGQIGWMVAIFLSVGYLAFLLAIPQGSPFPVLRRFFRRTWPAITLVPTILLCLALRERIESYGVTEDRYVLGAMAAAALILCFAWMLRRRLDPRLVPITIAVLLMVGAFGPLAARRMTVNSQAERFVAMLEQLGELKDGRLVRDELRPWGNATTPQIRSIITILESRNALHLIAPVLGDKFADKGSVILSRLGIDKPAPPVPARGTFVEVEDGLLLATFEWSEPATRPLILKADGGREHRLKLEDGRLVLTGLDEPLRFQLPEPTKRDGYSTLSEPRIIKPNGPQVTLVLQKMSWRPAKEAPSVNSISGTLLLRGAVPAR